ncbi:MAG: 50S ribosomal protein L3 [Deltaproteobacteria bacterium]|nr:50S ribosomal protein L3 [Deltaproteobacteria bacterium]
MNTRPGMVGRKVGMTQIFNDDGDVLPVTVIEADPNVVVRIKTPEGPDGYTAVQLGFGEQKPSRLNRPELGHLAGAGVSPPPRVLKEMRVEAEFLPLYPKGGHVRVEDVFQVGDLVDVTGISKGRGFAGVMRRHHFKGFESSHGTHEFFRHGGSIGTRLTPGMVFKGKRMSGQLGARRATVQNIRVVRVDAEKHLLYILGSVPGPCGATIQIRKAVRAR